LFVVFESLELLDEKDNVIKSITVKPVKHDEYNRIKNNPFKMARKREALRLTHNVTCNVNRVPKPLKIFEVISTNPKYLYKLRYLKRPKPIILYDAEEKDDLTIDGYYTRTECELEPVLHRMILEAAVKKAIETYNN
jgi:hypothetical protein